MDILLRKNRFLVGVILSILFCASIALPVKADVTMWTQTYGGPYNDRAYAVVETSDGGYAIAGTTEHTLFGQDDFWLVKTDAFGAILWVQTYGGFSYDEAYALVETSDGGYAIAGSTGSDLWVVKTDSYGNMEWNQTYGGEWPDFAYALVETSDGGYAIAGYTESFAVEDPDVIPLPDKPADFWLIKTDEFGNMEWNQTYGGKADERAYSLVVTPDDGYALVGGSFFVKTDEFGNVEWNQTYGGAENDEAADVVATSDGGYAIIGTTRSFGAGNDDLWLVKTDEYGNVEWNQTYGGYYLDEASCLVATSDGGYALAGITDNFDAAAIDFWLVKTDAFGNVEWNQTYGGEKWEFTASLIATSDGGYAIIGTTNSFGVEDSIDCWLVKTNATGDMEWHQTYGSPLYDVPRSVVETSDGGYALAGTWGKLDSYWPSEPEKDVHTATFCLIKTNALGDLDWYQTYGGGAIDEAYSLVETSDGGYALAGVTRSLGANGTEDFWLIKTDEFGVAPEAAWVIMPILMIATLAILISKKKLRGKKSEEARFLCGI